MEKFPVWQNLPLTSLKKKIRLETEANRFKQMVDLAPINIMFSTPEGVMTFMNKSSENTLRQLEKFLPAKSNALINNSIDWFHKRPEVNKKIIGNPANLPHKAIIAVGDQKLDLLVSPVTDAQGKYLGPMVTWSIVTDKLNLISSLTSTS